MAEKFDLSRLQDIQREILREFDALCRKKGWRYFLLGGSALGAVRHGGMIPWDDDIDVGMPRPDYIRFLREASGELPPHLFVQDWHSEPDCLISFAKIRDGAACSGRRSRRLCPSTTESSSTSFRWTERPLNCRRYAGCCAG